jgi:hypothetical protein
VVQAIADLLRIDEPPGEDAEPLAGIEDELEAPDAIDASPGALSGDERE